MRPPTRSSKLPLSGVLVLFLTASGFGAPPTTPAELRERFGEQQFAPEGGFVLRVGQRLPKLVWQSPESVAKVVADPTIPTRWFNDRFEEVRTADRPGRYYAYGEAPVPSGPPLRRAMTCCCVGKEVDLPKVAEQWLRLPWTGVGADTRPERVADVLARWGTTEQGATELAALLEGSELKVPSRRNQWQMEEATRQIRLKRKLMGLDGKPTVKATVLPLDGDPAPTLRQGSLKEAGMTAAQVRRIETTLDRWHADSGEPSAVVIARNGVTVVAKGYGKLRGRPVTPDTLTQGARFIDGLEANGGTEMAAPLRAALGEQGRAGHLKHVVFMTDGAVSNEAELFGLIHEQLGESRLFTVGIGSAPNSYFMRKAAEFGRGTFTYVGDTREVGERVQDLFEKLSRPVARRVRVDWQGNAPPEFYPSRLPSLYAGEPLIVVGRSECMSGGVRVDADIAGDLWSREVPVVGVMPGAGIGALWAREKIADLEDQHHRGGDAEALRQQIVDVALAHQLISRFTSLVAVESWISRPPGQQAERGAVENRAPRGQTVAMPRTATHADLMLLLGFLAMVAALMVQLALRRS